MKRASSALGFPDTAGPTIRYVTAVIFIVLGVTIVVSTIKGIHLGVLQTPRRGPPRDVYWSQSPVGFDILAAGYFTMAAWLIVSSIMEIGFARRRELRGRGHPALAVMDIVRPGWRERTARRKSPWKFLSVFLMFSVGGFLWYVSFRLMWQVHVLMFPSHSGQFSQFWPADLSFRPFVSSFLLAMPLGLSSLMLGAIIGNLLMWCIAPARRAFAREAVGCPELGFRSVMLSFLRWGWIPVVIGFGFSLIGACTLRSLR